MILRYLEWLLRIRSPSLELIRIDNYVLLKIYHPVGNCNRHMLSTYETYCDLRDFMIGKRMFYIIWFSEPGETRPANGRSADGAVVAEIVY